MYTSYVKSSPSASKKESHAAALSIFLSPGLLIIDHIHFQYNGFLYGILILSIVLARHKSSLLASGVLFAALLCLKHIYLYLAPAYFVYLLRAHCLGRRSIFDVRIVNCIKLGVGICAVAALAFGPFVYLGQIPQLLSRLFPFSRGLCHAYWAPNVWAMYSFADRVLIFGKWDRSTEVESSLIAPSCTISEITYEPRRSQQRYPRLGGRHVFCRPAKHITSHDIHSHLSRSDSESAVRELTRTIADEG